MKQLFSRMISLGMVLVLIAASSVVLVSAEDDVLTIDGEAQAHVGDTVTYTMYLGDATEPIVGFALQFFYNNDCLEYQRKSLTFEKFGVVFYNEKIPGRIPMNSSQINDLPTFDRKSQFFSATFKVIKAGEADFRYLFGDLYGEDMTYLKSYTITYSVTVGDKVVIEDQTPKVDTRKESHDTYGGDFINYADGMGEVNSPNGADHKEVVEENGTLVPYIKQSVQAITQVVATEKKEKSWFAKNRLIVILAAVVLGAAIAGSVVFVVRSGANKKEEAPAEDYFGQDPNIRF